ncbi:hypothetical protein EAH88_11895 [Rhodanobacter glycinis]|uniref:Uncharacterized protein n=1 Tax=Rhodanobacter glycinis TaxID=582702 RepID=A0A502C9B7_9GAMM|nr:hypothetical protein [Rhodanobacter glycinis]TPG08326.1 hypothetical protein EAH88_11895 [Rhodanobacter glycinis]
MKLSQLTAAPTSQVTAQPTRMKLSDLTGQAPAAPVEQLPTAVVHADARLPGILGTINDFGNDLGDATAHHLLNIPVGIGQLLAHSAKSVADTARPDAGDTGFLAQKRSQIVGAIDSGVHGIDQSIRQREDDYQRNTPTNAASLTGATIGEVLPWLTGVGEVRAAGMLPKAETTLQKVGQLAVEGGVMGAAQPVTGDGSYAAQKALQVGTGVVTGPVLHGIGTGVGAIRSGVSDVLEHVRDPQAIADRQILSRFGNDPKAVANLRAAVPDVPGERLTAAQANPSPEAIAQERVLRNNPATAADFVRGDNANNTARMDVVTKLAGTDADLEAAKLARKQAAAPFIDQHLTPATPEIRWNDAGKQIDDVLSKPMTRGDDYRALQEARGIVAKVRGGTLQEDDAYPMLQELEQSVSSPKAQKAFAGAFGSIDRNMIDPKPIINQLALLRNTGQGARATIRPALDAIANTLKESQNTRGKVPVDVLDSVRQNIKDYIVKPNGALASGQEIAALDPVKAKLTALIDTHAPGYSDYLATYAKHSEPINTMESVRELLNPNSPHSLNAAGDPQLTITRLRQVLRGDDKARYPMSDAARQQLDAVRASLERRMISDNKMAASGPGTAADLQAAQGSAIGRGLFGDPLAGKPGALSRSIGIGLGGTLGHMIPIPGAGIGGAMLGGLLPEAAQGVNAKIAQHIGSTALDSKATADAIERALLKQSQKKPSKLGELLLLGH